MGSLMPEMRPVNAGSLYAQIVDEGETGMRHWIGPRMLRLLDKAVDDLLGLDRYERQANHADQRCADPPWRSFEKGFAQCCWHID
jgi:hypothetical protein